MYKCLWSVFILLICSIITFSSCNKAQQMNAIARTDLKPSEIVHIESPEAVMIYKGRTLWIRPEHATVEAALTKELLEAEGIQVGITGSEEYLRDWMLHTTGNGVVNVCILYGILPATIYPSGNAQPDGSIAENWIETTDGDTILNHADYFGYNSSEGKANERGAMQNIMDLPDIEINVYEHNLKMVVTAEGKTLTPSLNNFGSDRPFPVDELEAEWFAEKVLATDPQGTLADPIIVRDGDRGRLAIVFHTLYKDNPKGEVAAEIIKYLLAK